MSVNWKPERYHSITPYLIINNAEHLIEFLKQAFDAEELSRMAQPDGGIMHAELRIGDSTLMLADATEQYPPTPAFLYLYVENTDAVYQKALTAGATSIREPTDEFYGDRTAAVKDAFGNQWGIATHVEDVSPEEMERRVQELG
jgi:PhnB protein